MPPPALPLAIQLSCPRCTQLQTLPAPRPAGWQAAHCACGWRGLVPGRDLHRQLSQ